MKHFNFGFLWGLRNDEFPEVYNQLSSVIEVESVEDVNVKAFLEGVISHLDEVDLVMKMRNPHPLTEVLDNQIRLRKDYLVSLRGKVNASLKSPIETERKAAKVLLRWINKHCKNIYTPSINVYNRMIKNMMTDYNLSLDTQEALSDLGVSNVWDSIVAITQEIDANHSVRTREKSADVKKAAVIRRNAYHALKMYLRAIELALSLEQPGDHFYLDCSRIIDNYLEQYRTRYLSRTTRRKNASEKAEENQPENHENDNQDGDTTPTDSQPESAGTSSMFNVMTLDGMDSHNGLTSRSSNGDGVMNNSVTNGKAIDGKKEEPSTGSGAFVNGDAQKPEKAIAMYNVTNNGIDQES
ncbi:MAG: DUF6261 family protein [Dysgonamonadaceae bacterium]|nr:DUF6261 family protein [Dysgonamonadaceae bacterium]